MKKVIGLTGPIGSGKSAVSDMLKHKGVYVIDADEVARKVVEKGEPALEKLRNYFGEKIIREDGSLDRKALGKIVFGDKCMREKLNRLVHPYIIYEIEQRLNYFYNQAEAEIAVIDAALLFETGLDKKTEQIWYVDAKEDLRAERIIARDGITHKEAMNRIKAQPGQQSNKERADVVFNNNENLSLLQQQVEHHFFKLCDKNKLGGFLIE